MITKAEQQILDVLKQEAERIEYGLVKVEAKVFKGKVTNIVVSQSAISVNINHDDEAKDE